MVLFIHKIRSGENILAGLVLAMAVSLINYNYSTTINVPSVWKGIMTRTDLKEVLFELVTDRYFTGFTCNGLKKYQVSLQEIEYVTMLTDDELKICISSAVDIIDELIAVNNAGLSISIWQEIMNDIHDNLEKGLLFIITIIEENLVTENIESIRNELFNMLGVGGSYAFLFSTPCFNQGLYSVYTLGVDNWECPEIYNSCVFFMLRVIMKINSDELA